MIFNARALFGGFVGYEPGARAFNAAVIDSLSEFDGQRVTATLVERANRRIGALRAITSEIIGPVPWLGDLDSNQGCPGQSQEFYR